MTTQNLPISTPIQFNPFPAEDRSTTPASRRNRPVFSCVYCREKKLRCDRDQPCNQCSKRSLSNHCIYEDRQLGRPSKSWIETSSPSEGGRETKRLRVGPGGPATPFIQGPPFPRTLPSNAAHLISLQNIHNGVQVQGHQSVVEASNPGIIETLQDRIERLERSVQPSKAQQILPRSCINEPANQAPAPQTYTGILTVKGSSIKYHGQNQRLALLGQFEDAKTFVTRIENSNDPWAISTRNSLCSLQRACAKQKGRPRGKASDGQSVYSTMLEILPTHDTCMQLVQTHLANIEQVYHVLHAPSFLAEYERFWDSKSSGTEQPQGFLPQLLVVLAIARNLEDSLPGCTADCGHPIDLYCDLVEKWLEGITGKQRMKFSILQTQTLLVIARQLSARQSNELWEAVGVLVRSAMTIGLHRDPTHFPNIPFFQAEQRRKLWASIVELDLQISVSCGMRPMVLPTDFSCRPPLNIDDSDLVDGMSTPPLPKSFEVWTDALVQAVLTRSLPCRLEAAGLAHGGAGPVPTAEVLRCGKELEEYLAHFPNVMQWGRSTDVANETAGHVLARLMLDMALRSALLTLYHPFVLHSSEHADHQAARRAAVESSLRILSYQDIFDPEIADVDVPNTKQYWDLFHIVYKNDIRQAGYIVCLEIMRITDMSATSGVTSTTTTTKSSPQDNEVAASAATSPWTKVSLSRAVQNILNSLARRMFRSGSDAKDVFSLTLVLQSVRTKNAQEKEALMRQAFENAIKTCQRQLKYSDGGPNHDANHDAGAGRQGNGVDLSPATCKEPSAKDNCQNGAHLAFEQFKDLTGDFDFDIDFEFSTDWSLDQSWL